MGEKMKIKIGEKAALFLLYAIIVIYAIVCLYPFFLTFITSLKPSLEANNLSIPWDKLSFHNYAKVFREYPYLRWFANSLVFTLGVTIGMIFVNSMAGYALARLRFFGRKTVFWLILLLMMVPPTVLLVPQYVILTKLGWINTFQGLILPLVANCGFVFMMRQFFLDIPLALEEAAMIDGASRFKIFWTVAMPLAKPAVVTMFVFGFIGNWNTFLWPLLITKRSDMYTLPVGLMSFNGQYFQLTDLVQTGTILLTVPPILIFVFLHRYYIQAAVSGAIKE